MPFVNSWLKQKMSRQYCLLEVQVKDLSILGPLVVYNRKMYKYDPVNCHFLPTLSKPAGGYGQSIFHLFVDVHLKRTILSNTTSLSIAPSLNLALLADQVSPSVGGGVVLRYIHKFSDTAPFTRWGVTPVPLSVAGLSGLLLRNGIGRYNDLISKTDIKGTTDSSLPTLGPCAHRKTTAML